MDDHETIFYVRDNGSGIDPRRHRKIFDLFYKVNPNSRGTGVGLAIVKRIIGAHRGRVWVESEPGKCCAMCFTLSSADRRFRAPCNYSSR
jgi:signal transduction histidine kinase